MTLLKLFVTSSLWSSFTKNGFKLGFLFFSPSSIDLVLQMSKNLSKFEQKASVSSVFSILLRIRNVLNPLATLELSTYEKNYIPICIAKKLPTCAANETVILEYDVSTTCSRVSFLPMYSPLFPLVFSISLTSWLHFISFPLFYKNYHQKI